MHRVTARQVNPVGQTRRHSLTHDQNGPEIYGTIFTIAPSRHDVNVIWTGSDDGLVQVTRDGGKTWQNVTPPGIGEFNRVSMIDASSSNPGGAYVAAKRYQMDDLRPYIFKTTDYGKTWTKIVTGIADTHFVHVVREDPKKKGLLYAGTEHGVYVSFDDGAQWRSLSLNMPDTQIADMVVEKYDLVVATHGRSFYVLDDIGAIRQSTTAILGKDLHLFELHPTVRGVNQAVIDYSLKTAAKKVTIEIVAPDGRILRTAESGAAPKNAVDADEEDAAPPSRAPSANAGLNRFRWDLRYPGPVTFPGIVLRWTSPDQGPLAPPGKYTVRVRADGKTESQTLVIERDPRIKGVTDADLQEQFKLAIQVRDKTSAAHAAVLQIRALREQAEQRSGSAGSDDSVSSRLQTIKSKLAEIEQDLYQTKNRSPRDTLNYPIKLNNQLAVLQKFIDTGNARPTDSDYSVFKVLEARLNAIRARLRAVLADDLPKLNQALAGKGLPPVTP